MWHDHGHPGKLGAETDVHFPTHRNEVESTCCHCSFALSCTYVFQTLVLHAPRFQYGTRDNENVLADLGFLKGPMLWKTERKKNAQWVLSAVETAPDRQDHVPTTPCFLFQNTSKHLDACRNSVIAFYSIPQQGLCCRNTTWVQEPKIPFQALN